MHLPFLTLALATIIQQKINHEACGHLNEAIIQILCLEHPFQWHTEHGEQISLFFAILPIKSALILGSPSGP